MFKKISPIFDAKGPMNRGDESSKPTTQGRFNGLLVVADSYDTVSKLALKVTESFGAESTKHIVNGVPLLALSGVHDIMRGRAPLAGDAGIVALYVDVGQLMPAGRDEVRIGVMALQALLGTAWVKVAGVESAITSPTEHFVVYEAIPGDPSVSVSDAVAIFAYPVNGTSDPVAVTPDELSFTVKVGDSETQRSLRDCALLTRCLGRTEATQPVVALIHGDPAMEEPAVGVHVQMTGTATQQWGFLVIRRDAIATRAAVKASELLARRRHLLEQATVKQPERVQALSQVIKLPDVSALRSLELRGIPRLG